MKGFTRLSLIALAVLCSMLAADCGTKHRSSTFTVHGVAITPYEGEPVSGVKVFVAGQAMAPIVTGSSGTFVLPGVRAPYDLVLVMGTEGATVYSGVTRKDPRAEVLAGPLPFPHTATIQGNVSGSSFPLGATNHVVVAWGHPVNDGTGNVDPVTGAWSIATSYDGPGSQPFTVAALEYDETNGVASVPVHFGGFAMTHDTITDGQTTTADLTLAPVQDGILPFVVTRPYPTLYRSWGIGPTAGDSYDFPFFFGGASVSTRGNLVVPVTDPPVPLWIQMNAIDTSGSYAINELAPAGLSAMTFDFPPALTMVQPSNGAAVSFAQPFEISGAEAQSLNVFTFFEPLSSPVVVVTRAASITIPDSSVTGLTIGTSDTLQWSAYSWGPASSVDDALAHGLAAPAAPYRVSRTDSRSVTLHH